MLRRVPLIFLLGITFVGAARVSSAQTLADMLPQLIAQAAVLAQPISPFDPTTIDPKAPDHSQSFVRAVTLTTVPTTLNASMALQLSIAPIGPTAGGLIYSRGGGSEMRQTFGGAYADRGVPMGRGRTGLAVTFQNDNYTTFDGVDLKGNGINFLFAHQGPSPDTSDVLQETVSMRVNRKVTAFLFNYGVSERFDVGVVAPIVQVAMDMRVAARVVRVRSSLDTLQSCAAVPDRLRGNGQPLRICQDPNGYDNILTLATHVTYLDLGLSRDIVSNNYGRFGRTARGIGDVLVRAKYALVARPSAGFAATIDLSLPTGNSDNLLGSGALRVKPGLAWSAAAGRVSPHASAAYTWSQGDLSSKLQSGAPAALDLKVPNEINVAGGIDASVAPRTTLVADFFGRRLHNVQRFATGRTVFATGGPGIPADAAAATDLIGDGRSDINQVFGAVGGRFHLGGSIFANGSVTFPVLMDGLRARPAAVFSLDYGF